MNRENIDNKYKWDLSLIYKNDEELNKDINKLKNQLEQNEKLVKDNKDNYMVKLKEEEDNWQKKITNS